MGWNDGSLYAGRQPPAARVLIRKAGRTNTGAGYRTYGQAAVNRHAPVDGNNFLMHEDSVAAITCSLPEETLQHFGITGMKWGVRRYQNEDGTLTEAGKKRYGTDKTPESETWKKTDAERLSDEELNRRNSRLQRERQYKDLTTSEVDRERKQLKNQIIQKVVIGAALGLAATAMRGHYKQAASFIGNFAKKKIAPLKAANILKNALKKGNIPDQALGGKEVLGKNVGKIAKNLINQGGRKIYANGPYESPIIKNRPYWRGL